MKHDLNTIHNYLPFATVIVKGHVEMGGPHHPEFMCDHHGQSSPCPSTLDKEKETL